MKNFFVYLMGFLYVLAGINHFIKPEFYVKMVENFLPLPLVIVHVSGITEIILGVGICVPSTRRFAAIGIIILLVAIFPANVNMLLHAESWHISPIVLWIRLPIQLLLIWWASVYCKVPKNMQ